MGTNIDFKEINYLKSGIKKQQQAYDILTKNSILDTLKDHHPILVGTIPINIDIDSSDLDIICYFTDKDSFKSLLINYFGNIDNFKIWEKTTHGPLAVVANFFIDGVEIEIFGQNKPTTEQNAYRHMLIEHQLLIKHGEDFRKKIIDLKKKGYKTEPAFAMVLGLEGNPYEALLELNFQ